MSQYIVEFFESTRLAHPLSNQIGTCNNHELAPLLVQLFREHQPVLDAGCASGRWCGWFHKHSIQCDGVDLSEKLCERASREIPNSKFIVCDMRSIPLPDGSYGGILALDSIEHIVEGPQDALKEFHRLLRPDGVAVIAVPYGGSIRILLRHFFKPLLIAKSWAFFRRLFGEPVPDKSVARTTLRQSREGTNRKWHPRSAYRPEGWFFFEYQFNKDQMREFLAEAGFTISKEFVGFGNEGIMQNFGRLAGTWNSERVDVDLTILGRFLKTLLPLKVMGHMLCYVVAKSASTKEDKSDGNV